MTTKVFLMGIIALTMCGITTMTAQVGINTDDPQVQGLHIIQKDKAANPGHGFILDDGTQAAGEALTSDANGVGSWKPVAITMLTAVVKTQVDSILPIASPTSRWVVMPDTYIDFSAGKWLVFCFAPFTFDTDYSDMTGEVAVVTGLTNASQSNFTGFSVYCHPPIVKDATYRDCVVFTLNVAVPERYFLYYDIQWKSGITTSWVNTANAVLLPSVNLPNASITAIGVQP